MTKRPSDDAIAQAVGTGIAAADDDDVLAGGENLISNDVACSEFVLLRQKLHREVDAFQLAARDLQIARLFRAAGQHDGVKVLADLRPESLTPIWALVTNLTPSAVICSMRAIDQPLLHLEIGNAVAEQAADAVRFFEHGHLVSGARELLRRSQTGGPRTDNGDSFAGAMFREAQA